MSKLGRLNADKARLRIKRDGGLINLPPASDFFCPGRLFGKSTS